MTIRHENPEHEFFYKGQSITGTAIFIAETESGLNADIGGRDGPEVTSCELYQVHLGGLRLDRDQMVAFLGEPDVAAHEADVLDELQASVDAGDYAEAA